MDICCGTGTIGIALSSWFDRVIGIEMVQAAIDDAEINVKLNELETKCKFLCGKAEDKIRQVCEESYKVI